MSSSCKCVELWCSQAFYFGAIGSRRDAHGGGDHLMTHSGRPLRRSHDFAYVGSNTLAEISVRVMTEILAVRNGVSLPSDVSVAHAKLG